MRTIQFIACWLLLAGAACATAGPGPEPRATIDLAAGQEGQEKAEDEKKADEEAKKKAEEAAKKAAKPTMRVHYLEIVTPNVDAVCKLYAETHGVKFGKPIPEFGNARTADLPNGSQVGVRAPMRASETPVVRPYWLVKDIGKAVAAAKKAGAEIAMGPMPMPGDKGQFAIYVQGGIQHGLWQK